MQRLIDKYGLFDEPEGRPFNKVSEYIASAMLRAGWDDDISIVKLESLMKYCDNSRRTAGVSTVPNMSRNVYTVDRYNLYTHKKTRETLRLFGVAFNAQLAERAAENERWDRGYIS